MGGVDQRLIAVVVLAVGVLAGGLMGAARQPTVSTLATADMPEGPSAAVDVHVGGWVVAPGVVRVPEGSIVADAVAAAGGARTGASVDRLNLAAPVHAGDQVIVPGPESESAPAETDGLLSLNRATASDLQDLPGVGPVLAERIVRFREDNGPFATVEDLLQVSGIGESKLAALRDFVRVP